MEGETAPRRGTGRGGGLAEPLVHLPAAAAGHQGNQPLKNGPVFLVLGQATVEEAAQEPAGLGTAKGEGVLNVPGAGIAPSAEP